MAAAMYEDPARNLASIGEVLTALSSDADEASLSRAVEDAIARVDAHTVERFETLLEEAAR